MITFTHKGNLSKTLNFLKRSHKIPMDVLEKYGDEGLAVLWEATPVDSGLTASSWFYEIVERDDHTTVLRFCNANVHNGVNVAVILQYGHATGTGGWVEGIDYINPVIQPIFNRMVKNIWREVSE